MKKCNFWIDLLVAITIILIIILILVHNKYDIYKQISGPAQTGI